MLDMKSTKSNDENEYIKIQDKTSVNEKLELVQPKKKNASFLQSEVSCDNVYTKKAIFRRKLIEKYSIKRYNLNTKLMYSFTKFPKKKLKRCNAGNKLIKRADTRNRSKDFNNTSSLLTRSKKRERALKIDRVGIRISDSSSSKVKTEKSDLSQLPCPIRADSDVDEKLNSKNGPSDSSVCDNPAGCNKGPASDNVPQNPGTDKVHPETCNSGEDRESEPVVDERNNNVDASDKNEQTPRSDLVGGATTKPDACNTSASSSTISVTTKKWKMVPISIYDHFAEMYKKNVKVERKRRKKKNPWTKSRKSSIKLKPENFHDPYVDCFDEVESADSKAVDEITENFDDKNIGMIVYLGVKRPLFPLVYQNIAALNNEDSGAISDMWANFSLSTLVTKPSDMKVKPALLPIIHEKLMSVVLEQQKKVPFELKEIEFKRFKKVDVAVNCTVSSSEKPQVEENVSGDEQEVAMNRTASLTEEPQVEKDVRGDEKEAVVNCSASLSEKPQVEENVPGDEKEAAVNRTASLTEKPQVEENVPDEEQEAALNCSFTSTERPQVEESVLDDERETALTSTFTSSEKPQVGEDVPDDDQEAALNRTFTSNEKDQVEEDVPDDDQEAALNRTFTSSEKSQVEENVPDDDQEAALNRTFTSTEKLQVEDDVPDDEQRDVLNCTFTSTEEPQVEEDGSDDGQRASLNCTFTSAEEPQVEEDVPETEQKAALNRIFTSTEKPQLVRAKRKSRRRKRLTFTYRPKKYKRLKDSTNQVEIKQEILETEWPADDGFAIKREIKVESDSEILQKHGYKSCAVVLPKLDLTQLPVASASFVTPSRSWQINREDIVSSQPTLPDADEEDNEKHFFGNEHCTRTYGSMIDFASRNRSLVYFYKMKRILKFQKQNNKLFQSCLYSRIYHELPDEHDTYVDVLSETIRFETSLKSSANEKTLASQHDLLQNLLIRTNAKEALNMLSGTERSSPQIDQESAPVTNFDDGKPKTADTPRKEISITSRNPLDVFKFPELCNYEDVLLKSLESNANTKFAITFVDTNVIKLNVKWLILRLNKNLVTIIYKRQHVLPVELLFQTIYRADLTKNVVSCVIGAKTQDIHPEFGVYGVPGLCDAVLLGPYRTHEKWHELSAMVGSVFDEVVPASVVECSINTFFCQAKEFKVGDVLVSWWKSYNNPLYVPQVNASFLNFSFVSDEFQPPKKSDEKIKVADIFFKHNCTNYEEYEIKGFEVNYVFHHGGVSANDLLEAGSTGKGNLCKDNALKNNNLLPRRIGYRKTNSIYRRNGVSFENSVSSIPKPVIFSVINKDKPKNHCVNIIPVIPDISNIEKEKIRREELARCREELRLEILVSRLSKCSDRDINNMPLVDILAEAVKVIDALKLVDQSLVREKRKLRAIRSMLLYNVRSHLKTLNPKSRNLKEYQLTLSRLNEANRAEKFEKAFKDEMKNRCAINGHNSSNISPPKVTNFTKEIDSYSAESYVDPEKLVVKSRIFKTNWKMPSKSSHETDKAPRSSNLQLKRRRKRGKRKEVQEDQSKPSVNKEPGDRFSVKALKIPEDSYSSSTVDAFEISRSYSPTDERFLFSEHSYCNRGNGDSPIVEPYMPTGPYVSNRRNNRFDGLHVKPPNDPTCVVISSTPSWSSPSNRDDEVSDSRTPINRNTATHSKKTVTNCSRKSSDSALSALLAGESDLESSKSDRFSVFLTENNKPITRVVIEKLKSENQNTINLPINDRRKRIIALIHKIIQEIVRRSGNKAFAVGNEERILIPRLHLLRRMLEGANHNRNFSRTRIVGGAIEISDEEEELCETKNIDNNILIEQEESDSVGNTFILTSETDDTLPHYNNTDERIQSGNSNDCRKRHRRKQFIGFREESSTSANSDDDNLFDEFIVGEEHQQNDREIDVGAYECVRDSYGPSDYDPFIANHSLDDSRNEEETEYQRRRILEGSSPSVLRKITVCRPNNMVGRYIDKRSFDIGLNSKKLINNTFLNNASNAIEDVLNPNRKLSEGELEERTTPISSDLYDPYHNEPSPAILNSAHRISDASGRLLTRHAPNILKTPKKNVMSVDSKNKLVVVKINGKPTSLSIRPSRPPEQRLRCPSFVPVLPKPMSANSSSNGITFSKNLEENMQDTSSIHAFYDNVTTKTINEYKSFVQEEIRKCELQSEKNRILKEPKEEQNSFDENQGSSISSRLGVRSFASISCCFSDMDRLLNF